MAASFLRRGTCVHFVGVQHECCEAGVVMRSVRDTSGGGPYRWPCLPPLKPGQTCATTCAQRREPTDEEIAASEREVAELIRRADDAERRNRLDK